MNGIRKTVKLLEDSGLLIKGVSETIKNEAKNHKRRFLEMLLGNLGTILLENLIIGKRTIRVVECTIRGGQDF